MFGAGKGGILAVDINDENALYDYYLSFVRGGGLFIPTRKDYCLGDEVFFILNIYLNAEPMPLTGKIVWVSPRGASGNRKEGIGVQLPEDQSQLRIQIEQALTSTMHSHKPTLTM